MTTPTTSQTDTPQEGVLDPIKFCDIPALVAAFGEPEYSYFKEWVQATGRGQQRRHYGSGYNEIPKEEYDAHRAQSRKLEMDRFMGRGHVGSFYRYEIRLKKPGWPQALEKALKDSDYKSRGIT